MNTSNDYLSQITVFRRRGESLRRQGYAVLLIVIMLLLVGGWIFYNADEITRADIKTDSDLTHSIGIEKRIEDLEKNAEELVPQVIKSSNKKANDLMDRFQQSEASIRANLTRIFDTQMQSSATATNVETRQMKLSKISGLERLEGQIYIPTYNSSVSSSSDFPHSFFQAQITVPFQLDDEQIISMIDEDYLLGWKMEINELVEKSREFKKSFDDVMAGFYQSEEKKEIDEIRINISELMRALQMVQEREFEQKYGIAPDQNKDNVSISLLVQTSITRFGSLFTITFIVGILINLYRYNIRLAGYYDARADALVLSGAGVNSAEFDTIVRTLCPEGYDFGRSPRLPIEQAVELAKAISGTKT